MAKTSQDQVVTVDGRTIKLTNLEKVLYPATGTTKADVLSLSWARMCLVMTPVVRNATKAAIVKATGSGF